MELSDIQKEIRGLILPHYLIDGIEEEIELKKIRISKKKDRESFQVMFALNLRSTRYGRIWNFAHSIQPWRWSYPSINDEPDDENHYYLCWMQRHDGSHLADLYKILEYFDKDGVDFDRYALIDEGDHLWCTIDYYLEHRALSYSGRQKLYGLNLSDNSLL